MLYQEALGQIQTALNDVDGAIRYMVDAERSHPNRIDICAQSTRSGGSSGFFVDSFQQRSQAPPSNPSSIWSETAGLPFGQRSSLGVMGSSPFGEPSQLRPRSSRLSATLEERAGSLPGLPTTGAQAGNPFRASSQTTGGGFDRQSMTGADLVPRVGPSDQPNPFHQSTRPAPANPFTG